jgi:cytochrome c-type biogenesis protein CcmE
VDLSPRTVTPAVPPAARRRRRRLGPAVFLAFLLIAGAVILFQFLSSASEFFCNADEVGHKTGCEVGKSFRLQGTVQPGYNRAAQPLVFDLAYGAATVRVTLVDGTAPSGIFCAGIPAVVEGHSTGATTFSATNILVKHTEQYEAANPGRVKDCGP